jgi:hypothetical protein
MAMRALPSLPFTKVANVAQWSNFHHTVAQAAVPGYLTPGGDGIPAGTSLADAQKGALTAILTYCFGDPVERLCTIGARWSLSNILSPANVILDPGIWNQMVAVDGAWLTPHYRAFMPAGAVPVVVQGGTNVRALNTFLGQYGLALQTSGASDGHRIAGCIATGTHGSDLKVGAVHDTVLGMLLVTAPGQAVLVQPSHRSFSPDLTTFLGQQTGLAITDTPDDELFNAARVSLGGLGFVHSVIVEAVPLYQFRGQTIARPLDDADIWHVLETLDTSRLDPTPSPDFFTVVFSPYAPSGTPGAYATLLWKERPVDAWSAPPPVQSSQSTDLTRLLSALIPRVDNVLDAALLGDIVAQETSALYKAGPVTPVFPGTYFGPTTLPEGNGRSSEVIVDHSHARLAVATVITALQTEARKGRHLLGGIGVRFVAGTSALLGPNLGQMNTYIEFPSLGSADTTAIHQAVWTALRTAGVVFTCHWGQEYGMDSASVRAYFGGRVDRWIAARSRILPTQRARSVFTNPLLTALGLG